MHRGVTTLFVLALVACAARAGEIRSANGRFRALLSEPSGEGDLRFSDVVVEELRERDGARRIWSGRMREDLRPGEHAHDLLSDDGAALVRLVPERAAGESRATRALVRELLKGGAACALDEGELGLPLAPAAWLDVERGLRWRADPDGLNCKWKLDLLGADGVVRTLALDDGTVDVRRDETLFLGLLVHPAIPEVLFPATREVLVDSFRAPSIADAGATVAIEGRGSFPSAGWRFAGFQVLGDARATRTLILSARGVPPERASAQVAQPHLWTARFAGLPPGTYALDVVGAETREGDPRRDPRSDGSAGASTNGVQRATLELVSPHLVAQMRREKPARGEWTSIALFDDGRIEVELPQRKRVELASLERWDALVARVRAIGDGRTRSDAELGPEVLVWRASDGPRRGSIDATLAAPARALADELRKLAEGLDPSLAPRAYALDARPEAAESTWSARVKRDGAGDALAITALRSTGTIELARDDLSTSTARFAVSARDLRPLVGAASDAERVLASLRTSLGDADALEVRVTSMESRTSGEARSSGEAGTSGDALPNFAAGIGRELAVILRGEITVRGIRRSIACEATLSYDERSARVRGALELRPTWFDLAGGGAPFSMGDVVEVRFDLAAHRRER